MPIPSQPSASVIGPGPSRRGILTGLAALAVAGPARAMEAPAAFRTEWFRFQSRFLVPEGRVIDTGNGGVSHSEGQGWGLLFALAADDQPGFERIFDWTRRVLRRPGDNLHAWRFRPDAALPVDDPNNATDGDLCIAWALLEAGARWSRPDYTLVGTAIARDILRLLVRRVGAYSVLLPGAQGFELANGAVINPSYYVFPAFGALARAVPDPAWVRVAADGLVLLRACRFGRWGLPPDWAVLGRTDGGLTLPANWPPRFSFDAVRVPLYLSWAGLGGEPALERVRNFWTDPAHLAMPAWADLTTDAVAPYAASPGVMAVARLAGAQRPAGPVAQRAASSVGDAPDYYSAALSMLARMASR
ncbi:glycosyl hydrolase family 5 [Belnapia sp. T18]|uniref:Glucanase n=1 Tax=Belnapia arida TaxID=2804533 RepID=A0ABS1U7M4_9PROT|nr:glycosyl hydrolase family 8 [Belnapia arida]MBL6079944.1 glycosyl hydrolase family 5 [Belnapia arida]